MVTKHTTASLWWLQAATYRRDNRREIFYLFFENRTEKKQEKSKRQATISSRVGASQTCSAAQRFNTAESCHVSFSTQIETIPRDGGVSKLHANQSCSRFRKNVAFQKSFSTRRCVESLREKLTIASSWTVDSPNWISAIPIKACVVAERDSFLFYVQMKSKASRIFFDFRRQNFPPHVNSKKTEE